MGQTMHKPSIGHFYSTYVPTLTREKAQSDAQTWNETESPGLKPDVIPIKPPFLIAKCPFSSLVFSCLEKNERFLTLVFNAYNSTPYMYSNEGN